MLIIPLGLNFGVELSRDAGIWSVPGIILKYESLIWIVCLGKNFNWKRWLEREVK